jgi:FkbM family methyltransferase
VINSHDNYPHILNRFPDAPDRFELTIREVYCSILAEGGVALDLGAHTGKHTLPMGRAVGARGRIYAFEPIKEKFAALVNNIQNSALLQITPINVCCLDENKIVNFVYLPSDPGKSAIHIRKSLERDTVEKHYQQCLAIRIDDFFCAVTSPQFLKIDIEGAELSALRGARQLILRARPIIHVEIGRPSLDAFGVRPEEIYQFLEASEYALVDVFGYSLPDMGAFTASIEATGVYDYFAIPREDSREPVVVAACKRMWGL